MHARQKQAFEMENTTHTEKTMDYTGERMVPEAADLNTYWEHVFRYAFACKLVKEAAVSQPSVLDIASGEGYGTYALSQVSKDIVGVDISAEAVEHARQKYGLNFKVGSAEAIPVESGSIDTLVSFETVEHVPEPGKFVSEAFRVLKPGGLFVVSTPNKNVYLKGQEANPFHCSEMTKEEFINLLNPAFEVKRIFGQVYQTTPLDRLQHVIGMFSDRLGYYVRRNVELALRSRYLPNTIASDAAERRRMVEAIPTLSPPFNRFWNPYALSALTGSSKNQPLYYVVVASRRSARI
jgi:2-polyprenyl-3-methyl-5-hydroxy-6-metoxy-1,4-benzoquinol methylase